MRLIRNKYIRLLLSAMALLALVVGLILSLKSIPLASEIYESNQAKSIDAESLFYTETSQFNETNNYMNNIDISK
jgi:uncharacterized protein YoxC